MNCQAFANLADLYREGRLTPGRRAEMERHAEGCADCQKLNRASARLDSVIKAPDWFKERLAKALTAAMKKDFPTEQLPPAETESAGRWIFAAAGAYACLLLVLYWTSPNIPNQGLEPLVAFSGETR